jgi:ABC-type sulfate transport system permease component
VFIFQLSIDVPIMLPNAVSAIFLLQNSEYISVLDKFRV